MAFVEGVQAGSTNDTTTVSMVTSPTDGKRIIKSITVYNRDTVAATIQVSYYDGSSSFTIYRVALDPGDTLLIDDILVLDSGGPEIQCVLAGAVTTNQLHYVASFGDST